MHDGSHFPHSIAQRCPSGSTRRPVWFVFAGMGTQWCGMGRDMLHIDVFRQSLERSDVVLKRHGGGDVDLMRLIREGDEETFQNTLNSFVGIAAIQVCVFFFGAGKLVLI